MSENTAGEDSLSQRQEKKKREKRKLKTVWSEKKNVKTWESRFTENQHSLQSRHKIPMDNKTQEVTVKRGGEDNHGRCILNPEVQRVVENRFVQLTVSSSFLSR